MKLIAVLFAILFSVLAIAGLPSTSTASSSLSLPLARQKGAATCWNIVNRPCQECPFTTPQPQEQICEVRYGGIFKTCLPVEATQDCEQGLCSHVTGTTGPPCPNPDH